MEGLLTMKNLRVGIPRALLSYSFGESWKAFFRELGIETIASPETTADILKEGIRRSTGDLCLPVKTFLGHVDSLREAVDVLFIPRYVSVEDDAWLCPKIIGLPDMVRASFSALPGLLSPTIHVKRDGDKTAESVSKEMAGSLSLPLSRVLSAYQKAASAHPEAPAHLPPTPYPPVNKASGGLFSDGRMNVGLVGRPYLLLDAHLVKNIGRIILNLGANPVFLRPPEDEIREAMRVIPKWVYWSEGKEVVAAAHAFFKDDDIDGVISVCSASCGPDSFTGELIKRLNARQKPLMSLCIDEHSSAVGIETRIEAFLDMIRKVAV